MYNPHTGVTLLGLKCLNVTNVALAMSSIATVTRFRVAGTEGYAIVYVLETHNFHYAR